jgi:hypothetical protein
MRRTILTALIWAALCGAAQAQKTGYHCTIRGATDRGLIQPLIFIAIDHAIDRVIVSDAAILGVNDGVPVEGVLVADNAARITVAWTVERRSASTQRVRTDFRATYLKASGEVNVTAQPQRHDGFFNRGGTCTVKNLSG